MQEIADGVIPLLFMKTFAGLDPPPVPCDTVSLARFTIMAYIFCAEQMPDAIFGFITMLKQKLTMTFEANINTYSLDMLLKVMIEDLRPSAAGSILLESIERLGKEAELSMATIIKVGIKYPILFYAFERFRKHMRRIIFGDKFWKDRNQFKLKFEEIEGSQAYFNNRFKSETRAVLETSRSIVSDVVSVKKRSKAYRLSDKHAPEVVCLEEVGLQKLKDIFGYERSRQLAVDSEIPMECESIFIDHAFGQEGPVQYPPRGVKIFPGGAPVGILDIPSDSDDDDDDDEKSRDGDEAHTDMDGQEFDGHDSTAAAAAAAGDVTPEGHMQSPPVTPFSPTPLTNSPHLTPMGSRLRMSMGMSFSMPSFASFALSWGTSRPLTAELEEEVPEPEPESSQIQTILDSQQGREFRYDPMTGKSAWVHSVVDRDGDLILEYCS